MPDAAKYPNDHISATRRIDASAHAVFTVLRDPARHHDTEPTDWVRGAIDPTLITGTGVTLTYDWSRTPREIRDQFGGFPVVSPDYLDQSLQALEQAVAGSK